MGNIISLILSIVMLYVIYYIFSNYDFKTALIVNMAYGIIVSIINNGFNILAIILGIIVTAVEVYILYKIYNKSNSFGQFLGKALLHFLPYSLIILCSHDMIMIFFLCI